MKILYISDLDGTLLSPSAELTQYTIRVLSELSMRKISFTAATARSPYSVKYVLNGAPINLPLVLMNGAIMYDLQTDRILSYEQIPADAAAEILRIFEKHGLKAFAYSVDRGVMTAFYESLEQPQHMNFYKERLNKYNKKFVKADSLFDVRKSGLIYITTLYKRSILEDAYREISRVDGVGCVCYKDVYSADLWYLEIFSECASKRLGALKLKHDYGFDKIVAFGDSANDIPLFEASDVKLAVENACPELKSRADSIIGSNMEDGVAGYLERLFVEKQI